MCGLFRAVEKSNFGKNAKCILLFLDLSVLEFETGEPYGRQTTQAPLLLELVLTVLINFLSF